MVDSLTANMAFTTVPRGGDAGAWDTPVNANTTALDGVLGATQAISLTNANVTLTVPGGFTATPGAGPTQSQNAIIRFTGTLTGNCVITFPRPGIYVVENRCTVGAFYVQLTNGGGGEVIGAPPGKAVDVYSDGTNMRFRNLPDIGAFMDLCGVTAVPAWIGACTVPPWLLCDGSVYNIATYTFLGNQLGATFGGNGSTTFAVPDLRGRWRVALDSLGTRLTSATMSPNGNTLAATGGAQNQTLAANQIPPLTTGTESATHTHTVPIVNSQTFAAGSSAIGKINGTADVVSATESATHTHSIPNASQQPVTTLPPVLVTGITLIRAG
jgi:microcystin-dependent protein